MITADSPFLVTRDRISRDAFARVLHERAASGVIAERDPATYYDANRAIQTADGRHVDALFLLAMFNHESSMGKAGVARQTHSWGNTREPNFGAVPVGRTEGASGWFPVWRDWLDGMKSTSARLVSDQWVYAHRGSIREVFDYPPDPTKVWAPAGDMNDPAGYLNAVVTFMNRYATPVVEGRIPRPPMVERHSPNRDGYGIPRRVRLIVEHIADGEREDTLRYFSTPGNASSNYVVDRDGTIYEVVPLEHAPHTNGDVQKPDMSHPVIADIITRGHNPNPYSATIENIGYPGDDLTPAQIAANQHLVAWIAEQSALPVNDQTVIGHYRINSVTRWYCPSFSSAEWAAIINGAAGWGAAPQPERPPEVGDPNARYVPETGAWLAYGFKAFWEDNPNALKWLGFPVENERGVGRYSIQKFERGWALYDPEEGEGWRVHVLPLDRYAEFGVTP